MADRMPRIFRTLETRNGRNAFDTIVVAAVTDFLAIRHPAAAHSADFSRLVSSIWSKLSAETKRQVALAIAGSNNVPRAVVELLVSEPAEISAPFLFSSPCITREDAVGLSSTGGGSQIGAATISDGSPPPDHHRIEPQRQPNEASRTNSEAPIKSAAAARDVMRSLARTGSQRPPSASGEATDNRAAERPKPTIADLLETARTESPERTVQLLATALQLTPEIAARLSGGADGQTLAAALKALGLSRVDVMTALIWVHQPAGRDVAVFDALHQFYEDVSPESCHAILGLIYMPPTEAEKTSGKARHQPLHAEGVGYRPITTARKTPFGRRGVTPLGLARRDSRGN